MSDLKTLLQSNNNLNAQFNQDGDGSIRFHGEKPSSLLGRLWAGFNRITNTGLQNVYRLGTQKYLDSLETTNSAMAQMAREHFTVRLNKGQPITLRAVREMAVKKFCTEDFINTYIIPTKADLKACQDDEAKDQLWTKATEALELIKAHLDPSHKPEDDPKPYETELEPSDLIDAKILQCKKKLAGERMGTTRIFIAHKYFKLYRSELEAFQKKYEHYQDGDYEKMQPNEWKEYKDSVYKMVVLSSYADQKARQVYSRLQSIQAGRNATDAKNAKKLSKVLFNTTVRKNIVELMQSTDDSIPNVQGEELKNLRAQRDYVLKVGLDEVIQDGLYDKISGENHRAFWRKCETKVQTYLPWWRR